MFYFLSSPNLLSFFPCSKLNQLWCLKLDFCVKSATLCVNFVKKALKMYVKIESFLGLRVFKVIWSQIINRTCQISVKFKSRFELWWNFDQPTWSFFVCMQSQSFKKNLILKFKIIHRTCFVFLIALMVYE